MAMALLQAIAHAANRPRNQPCHESGVVAPAVASWSNGAATVSALGPDGLPPGSGGVSMASSMRDTSRICRARRALSAAFSRGPEHP
jgi:hypothetical protein